MVLFEECREPNCVITGLTIDTGSSLNQQHHYFLEIMILSSYTSPPLWSPINSLAVPLVYHQAYSAPLPSSHRFPMG